MGEDDSHIVLHTNQWKSKLETENEMKCYLEISAHKRVDNWIHETVRHRDPVAEKVAAHKSVIFEIRIDSEKIGLEIDQKGKQLHR